MPTIPLRSAVLALSVALSVSACATDDRRYGRPYGGVEVGFAGDPYWGWYGDYYYPGSGLFVYDRYRHRVPWNAEQQHYWGDRQARWQQHDPRPFRNNWHDFRRGR